MEGTNSELAVLIGRLDGKVDMVLANQAGINARFDKQDERFDRHDERITVLENHKAEQTGGVTVLTRALTLIASLSAVVMSALTYFKGIH